MIQVDKQLRSQWDTQNTSLLPRLLMQIHDELIYEVSSCQVEAFQHLLRASMETHIVQLLQLKVPLIINLHVGPSLGDLV